MEYIEQLLKESTHKSFSDILVTVFDEAFPRYFTDDAINQVIRNKVMKNEKVIKLEISTDDLYFNNPDLKLDLVREIQKTYFWPKWTLSFFDLAFQTRFLDIRIKDYLENDILASMINNILKESKVIAEFQKCWKERGFIVDVIWENKKPCLISILISW